MTRDECSLEDDEEPRTQTGLAASRPCVTSTSDIGAYKCIWSRLHGLPQVHSHSRRSRGDFLISFSLRITSCCSSERLACMQEYCGRYPSTYVIPSCGTGTGTGSLFRFPSGFRDSTRTRTKSPATFLNCNLVQGNFF